MPSSNLRATLAALVVMGGCVASGQRGEAVTSSVPHETLLRVLHDVHGWDAAADSERQAAARLVASTVPTFRFARFESFACGGESHQVAIFGHEATGLEFVLVPGGTFQMGSPEVEIDRTDIEPLHAVTISDPFLISRTEVTNRAWRQVVAVDAGSADLALPVINVSWYDAEDFCTRAGLRLPSEAQWEYACRAGAQTAWPCGDNPTTLLDYAWVAENSTHGLHAVAEKRPNAFGLFDVIGNATEWCADKCDGRPTAYVSSAVTDPMGAQTGRGRVVRGGNWVTPATASRCAVRTWWDSASGRDHFQGFRPVAAVTVQ